VAPLQAARPGSEFVQRRRELNASGMALNDAIAHRQPGDHRSIAEESTSGVTIMITAGDRFEPRKLSPKRVP
jgi:hypothetical protein